jgi:sensor c-di-GMP phosphodiesterase-like protein
VIDDFGTSYTSLVNLKRYPIDKLKIDKSLIGSIPWMRTARHRRRGRRPCARARD